MRMKQHCRFWIFTSLVFFWSTGYAVVEGDIVVDPPTRNALGFFVNYPGNQVSLQYRVQGATDYRAALDLLKLRAGQFAGSVLNLQSGTWYEIKFSFDDGTFINKVVQTLALPLNDPSLKNLVNITDDNTLASAINNAKPGDVLFLKNGIYLGPITVSRGGTLENPVILRGESQAGVVIESPTKTRPDDFCGTTASLKIEASHVYVENLSIRGELTGINIESNVVTDIENVVVRNTKISNVDCGLRADDNVHRNHYFCNNVLQGKYTNADTGRQTWNINGIYVTGQGITVCHNTLSGFGDTIDIPNKQVNRAIDIFSNDILWGADDGLELDGGERNIRAYSNRVSNSGTGVSVQPGGGGPIYIYRNVVYNTGMRYADPAGNVFETSLPFKFKNNPSGLLVFHNTAIRPGAAWQQGETFAKSQLFNNLILGTTSGASFGIAADTQVDSNGFNQNTVLGTNGVRLNFPIFIPEDPILTSGGTDWTLYLTPGTLELAVNSSAINRGRTIANINDDFNGSAPDLGAIEYGQLSPSYGVTLNVTSAPSMVTGLMASGISDSVVELSWTDATDRESGISSYIVYRNGVVTTRLSGTRYSDTQLTENSIYQYSISAVNGAGMEGVRSAVVTGTTLADISAPELLSVSADGSPLQVIATFNEPVSISSANNIAHYSINNGVSISGASLAADGLSVTLKTSTLVENTNYRLTVNDIVDRAASPNSILADSGRDFVHRNIVLIDPVESDYYSTGILNPGATVYKDRGFTYTNVPAKYLGLAYLLTRNDDKASSVNNAISFQVNQEVTVYVGYDRRNTTLPEWLQGWTPTGDPLTSTDTDSILILYAKTFALGTVILGRNEFGNSMYVVLVAGNRNSTGSPGGTVPDTGSGTDTSNPNPGGSGTDGQPAPAPSDSDTSPATAEKSGAFGFFELCLLLVLVIGTRDVRYG